MGTRQMAKEMTTPMDAVPFLKLENAHVHRGGKLILSVDELCIPEDQSIALLGPNGSGKTTFVSLITREVFPLHRDEPPVVFRGDPRPTLADVKACIGTVSASMQQQIRVHLPVLDVVIGGLFGTLGLPKRTIIEESHRLRALQAMEELGIANLAQRDIMTLSSGQARRALIARALVNDPDILVFDEPSTGLDPEGMFSVRKTMRHLAQHRRSVILVTHYLEDIIPEIDRVILLKEGSIFADGAKEDILTDAWMEALFSIPAHVRKDGAYFHLVEEY